MNTKLSLVALMLFGLMVVANATTFNHNYAKNRLHELIDEHGDDMSKTLHCYQHEFKWSHLRAGKVGSGEFNHYSRAHWIKCCDTETHNKHESCHDMLKYEKILRALIVQYGPHKAFAFIECYAKHIHDRDVYDKCKREKLDHHARR